jgi:hypothetical protein
VDVTTEDDLTNFELRPDLIQRSNFAMKVMVY